MKKLLLIFLIPFVIKAQLLTLFSDDVINYFALDLDGSTEYAYINNPTGLDLNSANYLSGANSDFTATYISDFSSGVDGWTDYNSTLKHYSTDYNSVGRINCILDSVTAISGITLKVLPTPLVASNTYNISFLYYIPSANTTLDGIVVEFRGGATLTLTSDEVTEIDNWALASINFTATGNHVDVRLKPQNTTVGDIFYADSIIITPTNWQGLTYTGTKATFSGTAKIPLSALSTAFESGKNYTVQLKASSLASSDLKVKVGNDSTTHTTTGTEATKAWTFTYTGGDTLYLIGNGTDTYTIDDVDVSERRDASYDGYVKLTDVTGLQRILSNRSSNLGFEIYTANASEVLTLFVGGGASSVTPTITYTLTDNTWCHYVISISGNTITANMDGVSKSLSSSSIATVGAIRSTNLSFGAISTPANYLNGELGLQTITVGTSTSIYDWSGNSDTFLDDKGDQNNDLTGVNVVTPDDVEIYKGTYK